MGYRGGAEAVAFVYLRSASDRPPARVEFPAWLLEDEDGQLDRVMDVLRAQQARPARAYTFRLALLALEIACGPFLWVRAARSRCS